MKTGRKGNGVTMTEVTMRGETTLRKSMFTEEETIEVEGKTITTQMTNLEEKGEFPFFNLIHQDISVTIAHRLLMLVKVTIEIGNALLFIFN